MAPSPIQTSSTTVTTTPASSSTTTTLPSTACASGATFVSIACRVDELLALVQSSGVLGPLQPSFVTRVVRAQRMITAAAEECAAGDEMAVRSALDVLGRQLTILGSRTRTNRARKIIPVDVVDAIASAVQTIGGDVQGRGLRASLACP